MAIRQPLFEQNDTSDQSADIARLLIRDLVNDHSGIIQESAFQVTQRAAGANNSVDVQAGGIIIPGTEVTNQGYYYAVNDSVVNIPMSTAAHGSLPRIDSVVVDVRDGQYSGLNNDARITYQAGTAAASPSAPDLAALGYKNFIRLANISVPANDNTITTADITDQRITTGGRASAVGGLITCTSSTRPALPRPGQLIWETNTQNLLVNAGTATSPTWQSNSTGIVAQQKLTSNSASWAADANTDMVLNNVPVIAGHTYGVHAHIDVQWSSVDVNARWVIRLRVNAVDNATIAHISPRVAGVAQLPVDALVYWVAPSTLSTDDFLIRVDMIATGASLVFEGSSTNPRWFTIFDMGIL
jgi:hypothetical protein